MRIRTAAVLAAATAVIVTTVPAGAATKKVTKKTTTKATTKAPAATVAPTTAAPAAAAAKLPATVQRLKDAGKIRIGVKYDVPFMGLQSAVTGDLSGFDTEIGKIIARAIYGTDKGKIEWVEAISRNREPFIQENKVDIVISTYTINDARKKLVDFAGPYVSAKQDILIYKIDADTIKSVADLNGKKVCSVQGSTSLNNVKREAPKADVVAFNTYSECVEALKDGRVQAVTTDNLILIAFAKKFPAFQLVNKPFTDEPYGIGLKRCDSEFRSWINDLLEKSVANGDYKKAWDADNSLGDAGLPNIFPPAVNRYVAEGC